MAENYIARLQRETAEAAARQEAVFAELTALLVKLESPKYRCGDELDGYVNIADIAPMVREIRTLVS